MGSPAKLMEQSDVPGLEVKVSVENEATRTEEVKVEKEATRTEEFKVKVEIEATKTEEVKVESDVAKTDEDKNQWNKNKGQGEGHVVEQSSLLMNDKPTMLEKRNENRECQEKLTAGLEQVSIDQDSKESPLSGQESSEEIPKENGLVIGDHGKPSSTENGELEQGQEKLEKNVQNLRCKEEEEEEKSKISTDIKQPKEEEKSETSNDTKQPKEEQEKSATSSDIKDPKVEEELTISTDIKQPEEKEEEKSDTSNDIQQPMEGEKSDTSDDIQQPNGEEKSTDIKDPRVEEESATTNDIKQPKEKEEEEKSDTSNDSKQNKREEEKSATSSDIKEPEAIKGDKSNFEPENSAINGGPDLENKNKEDSNSKGEIPHSLEPNPEKSEKSNRSLKRCSCCGSEEPAPKAYKKCLK